MALTALWDLIHPVIEGQTRLLMSLVLLGFWAGWWLWKFKIFPALRPDEPKELPYWIPFIGHSISFFKDVEGTILRARKHFGYSPEPFVVTIAGLKTYILVSVDDIYAAQKTVDELTHDISTVDFMARFGVSQCGLKILFAHPLLLDLEAKSLQPNPTNKNMTHLGAAFFVTQLIPGPNLKNVQDIALRLMGEKMTCAQALNLKMAFSAGNPTAQNVSLLEWTSRTFIESTTSALFGPALLEIEPQLADIFTQFDDKMWKLLYSFPSIFSQDMLKPKRRLHSALMTYLDTPKHNRPGDSWFVRTFEEETRARGLNTHDTASCLAMVFWVANTNTWRLTFWIIAYILHDPHLHSLIEAEVLASIQPQENISISCHPATPSRVAYVPDFPTLLNNAPTLNAVYLEVLRVKNSPISLRHVRRPYRTATGKTLRSGLQVMLAQRQLLRDPTAFALINDDDTNKFNPERFMPNKKGEVPLAKSRNFAAFGGGTRLCPGRFLARAEVLTFIGLFFSRFEAKMSQGKRGNMQSLPRENLKAGAGMGILSPVEGDDVWLDIRIRETRA